MDHPRSEKWNKLQSYFLSKTTQNYSRMIYLNGRDNFYKDADIVKIDESPATLGQHYGQSAHIRGLNSIIDHFNNSDFEDLLLLDSDAFPIKNNWQHDLKKHMSDREIAAVVRYENLDTFAHPSVFYVKKSRARNLKFEILPNKNLIGFEYADTAAKVEKFFPLIRSNRLNHHPILCGVYWDRFYHHGAGSRNLSFRLFYSYFNEDKNVHSSEIKLFDQLNEDPDKFIGRLTPHTFEKRIF